MSNLILEVEEIQNYIRRDLPEGGEWLIQRIPRLMDRITELERCLIPFARQAVREQNAKVPLTQVYISDCKRALTALSRDAAIVARAAAAPPPTDMPGE